MSIAENLDKLKEAIPEHVTLVAVSKTKSNEEILQAYQHGHKIFGENKAQELTAKYEALPKEIEWHMIGHLQRNKVKYLAPFVSLIHSVDSKRLLKAINKEGRKNDRVIPCLLQMHIAREQSKFGLDLGELKEILESEAFKDMKNVQICGLMGMATFTDNMKIVKNEFEELKSVFEQIKTEYFTNDPYFKELSMGMSNDYNVAIESGASMVRIGSLIFGPRNNGNK